MPRTEKKRKPRDLPAPHMRPSKPVDVGRVGPSESQLGKARRENITLQDWHRVFHHIDIMTYVLNYLRS